MTLCFCRHDNSAPGDILTANWHGWVPPEDGRRCSHRPQPLADESLVRRGGSRKPMRTQTALSSRHVSRRTRQQGAGEGEQQLLPHRVAVAGGRRAGSVDWMWGRTRGRREQEPSSDTLPELHRPPCPWGGAGQHWSHTHEGGNVRRFDCSIWLRVDLPSEKLQGETMGWGAGSWGRGWAFFISLVPSRLR